QVDGKRERVMERIRAVRARKLTQALGLDEATAAALFPILERHDAAIARLVHETGALRRELAQASRAGGVRDAALDERAARLFVLQRQLIDLHEARFREARTVLTAEQAAALL